MVNNPVVDKLRIIPRDNEFLNRNVNSSGEVFFSKESNTLRLYNGSSRGGFELVTENNIRRNIAAQQVATIDYTVTINNSGSGNKYILSSVEAPQLSFMVGYTYVFDQSDSTNVYYPNAEGTVLNMHPLLFSSDNINGELAGGTTYQNGVIYILDGDVVTKDRYTEFFNRATTRKVQITVTSTTPSTLYYYCANHLNMGNSITVAFPNTSASSGGAQVDVSATPPDSPSVGNIWFNSTTGQIYVYISDADGTQAWIQPASPLPQTATANTFRNIALSDSTQFSANGEDTLRLVDGPGIEISSDPITKSIIISAIGNSGGGVDLTAFSIGPDASPDSAGGITYNNSTGVFTFIPPDLSSYLTSVSFADITNTPTTLSGYGITDAVEGTDLGSFIFSGSTIDTSDSSGIVVNPSITLQSDITVQNDIIANNKILANEFISTSTTAPIINSASTLTLEAADAVIVSGAPFRLPSLTEAQRDALTPVDGDMILNTTTGIPQVYTTAGGGWNNIV